MNALLAFIVALDAARTRNSDHRSQQCIMLWAWLRHPSVESDAVVDLETHENVAAWNQASSIMSGLNVAKPDLVPVVCWSGSLAEIEVEGTSEPATLARSVNLFAEPSVHPTSLWRAHPLTWSARGWAELERRLESSSGTLVLRTHARHVLSDLPGVARLVKMARDLATSPRVQVLVDPASMLTPSMFESGPRDAMDYVRRVLEWCAEHATNPAVWGVVVSNVRARADMPDLCEPSSLSKLAEAGSCLLNADTLAALFAEHLPPETRRVLVGAEPESQREQLERAARTER